MQRFSVLIRVVAVAFQNRCYSATLPSSSFFPLLKQKVATSLKLASSSNGLQVKGWNKSLGAASLSNSDDERDHKGKNIKIQAESVVNWLLVHSQLPSCLSAGGG